MKPSTHPTPESGSAPRIGEQCPFCFKILTEAVFKEKRRRKVQNALASTAKMKAAGNKPGPKSITSTEYLLELRARGLSIRSIAKAVGLSHGAVHRRIK